MIELEDATSCSIVEDAVQRDNLEWTVEDILLREGRNDITCIDLRLLKY